MMQEKPNTEFHRKMLHTLPSASGVVERSSLRIGSHVSSQVKTSDGPLRRPLIDIRQLDVESSHRPL